MANYSRLDTMVRATVKSNKKVAICPFAEEGMLTKQILNQRYGVQETYIIDNRLAEINPAIIAVEDLRLKDTDGLVVLLTITNREINRELENQINSLGLNIEIQNYIRPALMHSPEKKEYFEKVKSALYAKEVEGVSLIRIGKEYDGGYCLADDFSRDLKVYSFGIAGDVSFDKQMAERDMDIHMYDHTIPFLPESHERFHFHRTGISNRDEAENNKLSMETILAMNGDIDNENLILKMDVEGAEWEFLNDAPSELLKHFVQITFELHRLTDIKNEKKILNALHKLNETHQLVWIHANNFGHIEEAAGIEIPAYIEVTYLNKSRYRFKDAPCCFPLEIDMADSPQIEEVVLGNWGKTDGRAN